MRRLLYAVLLFAFLQTVQAAPEFRGMTLYGGWNSTIYGTNACAMQIDNLRAMGCNWVAIIPQWFQDTRTSNTVYQSGQSPTDASLTAAINYAHAAGLKVLLKPHSACLDGTWGGAIAPSNPGAWQTSYRAFILRYARLAQSTGCEMFCVGTEYQSMTLKYPTAWRALIADVRAVYGGLVTYSAAGNYGTPECYNVSFWDALDVIGAEGYWYGGITPQVVTDYATKLASRYPGKPIVMTEIGFNASAADSVAAYTQAWGLLNDQPWFGGWFPWSYSCNSASDPVSVYMDGKPELAAMWKSLYAASVPPPPDEMTLLKAQLAAVTAERDALKQENANLSTLLDAATATIARLRTGLAGIRDTAAGLAQ